MKMLTAAQMREVDRLTTEKLGIPGSILMENAGTRVVEVMEERFKHMHALHVAVVAGKGHNGGDGFVVARQLHMRGVVPHVYVMCKAEEIKGDSRANFEILKRLGDIPITEIPDGAAFAGAGYVFGEYQVIVDALLGTGITGPVEGFYAEVIQAINRSSAQIVAVDVPSGLPSDECAPVENAVFADVTVTFTAPKPGLVLGESHVFVGDLHTVAIGTPDSLVEIPEHHMNIITREDVEPFFIPRKKRTHKGNYGHILLVGGCRGKTGAAQMAGLSALRGGAGLVTVSLPECFCAGVVAGCPELMVEALPSVEGGVLGPGAVDPVLSLLSTRDLLILGPGMGTGPETQKFVHELVPRLETPAVIDADGLNCIAAEPGILGKAKVPLVLTPHPGEMARLLSTSSGEVEENREEIARSFAREFGVYLVLKGHRTVLAEPGGQVWINMTGNPGMATAGAGDVLSGLLGAFCARINHQNPDAWGLACRAAVHVHGMAGDMAAEELCEESVISGDIISHIPKAIRRIKEDECC